MGKSKITLDGNAACAYVAHATNEVIAIYPITPSSGVGEIADARSAQGLANIWGQIPSVSELQSEGGASGAVHGSLTTGSLTTTFTASQGLLLMVPNMFKIAGELTPTVFHVTARTVASHALSIFCDHSDCMAVRSTGFAFLFANNVQEVMDFALISQASTLESRIPFLHIYDGFRTSHEIQKIEQLSFDDMRKIINDDFVDAHHKRGLTPEAPVIRGTSQNPDVFFQERETVNSFYNNTPEIVQKVMNRFAQETGRQYNLFDYVGAPDAERIIIIMGSGGETVQEAVEYLIKKNEKVGFVRVRLYRPFSISHFIDSLPKTVKKIAVLDRTKEPGAVGEPLYLDVHSSITEAVENQSAPFSKAPLIVGGRYGLGSKEFTPAMVKAVFDNLSKEKPRNRFTVGINDNITNTSLKLDSKFISEDPQSFRGIFYGLGSDGTVSANKNSIKIIGENTENYVQGYFVYDSKKAGSQTVSHLRFGKTPILGTYLIQSANFVACHNFSFLEKYDLLTRAENKATFLLASPYDKNEIWDKLPRTIQEELIKKQIRFYIINANKLALELGLGARINIIMQTAFFAITDILSTEEAVKAIKEAVQKTYGKKGEKVVQMNYSAVDKALKEIEEVSIPANATSTIKMQPPVPENAPDFVKNVIGKIIGYKGDDLPVSAFPKDGTYPTATSQYEKRNVATHIPQWDPESCIQCGQCSLVCPHAAIRMKIYDKQLLNNAPAGFKSTSAKGKDLAEKTFTLQVAPYDCTGCGTCVRTCPIQKRDDNKQLTGSKAINMVSQIEIAEVENKNFNFFLSLPDLDVENLPVPINTIKGSQLIRPLFEFSGACAGCGETPYVKLLTQLFGDRTLIANATGCSSIYGGNLPTTPYCKREDGRGPAWSNSLFEDNAEFGFGMRLSLDQTSQKAFSLLEKIAEVEGFKQYTDLIAEIRSSSQKTHQDIEKQRKRITQLKKILKASEDSPDCAELLPIVDYLTKKCVWILGGDGWAYDIGYGGLDHVLASGKNINILVLDTGVYSNTGGQMSKATPMGAIAKFAANGKSLPKKDLALLSMTYGNVYVARIALGANPAQTIKALIEAEMYDGPSIVIAYTHCIAHGINMTKGLDEQKNAVASGDWLMMRFNPDLLKQNKNPLQIDSKPPSIPLEDYVYNENRFRSLKVSSPERAKILLEESKKDIQQKLKLYQALSNIDYTDNNNQT